MPALPTLLFLDSFDHYDTAHISSKWTIPGGAVDPAFGRNGQGMNLGAGGGGVAKTVQPKTNFTVGFAVKINIGEGLGGTLWSLSALSGSGGLDTLAQLRIASDGTFITWAGNNVIDNPKSFTYSNSTWMYVEIFVSIGGGNPINITINLRVNGVSISNKSAASNVNQSDLILQQAYGNYHFFGGGVNLGSTWIDDLYIATGGDTSDSAFYGDVRIGCIYPRQDTIMNFTPLTGSNGYSMIREHPPASPAPDDDTTYIFDNTPFDKYSGLFDQILTLTDEVQAVQFCVYARKDDEGSRAITALVGSFTDVVADYFYLSDNYYYHTFPYTQNPGGGVWTPAIINATSFGVEIEV